MSILDTLKVRAVSILCWSEQYTRTDMLYLARGGFWLSLGQGVAIVSSLLLSVAFANLLPPEVYGQYRFVIAAGAIIGAFALTGMGTAIIQAVARGYDGSLRAGFRESLRWSIGTTVLALCASAYYYFNDNLTLALSFLPIAIAMPLMLSSSLYQGFLNGKKDFRRATLYNIAHKLLHFVIILTTLFLTQNPIIIVAVYFATEALIALILYTSTLSAYHPGPTTDRETLPYSKHLSVMEVMKLTASHIDKVFVFHHLGAAQLAVYAFALAPVSQLIGIERMLASIALPKFSEHSYTELQRTLPKKVFLLMFIMGAIAGLYIVSAPYLFQYLFPQYIASVPYSQVYTIALILIPSILFNKAMVAHRKTRHLYIVRTFSPTIKFAFLIVLLPMYGTWGAIAALLSAQAIGFLTSLILFLKKSY